MVSITPMISAPTKAPGIQLKRNDKHNGAQKNKDLPGKYAKRPDFDWGPQSEIRCIGYIRTEDQQGQINHRRGQANGCENLCMTVIRSH